MNSYTPERIKRERIKRFQMSYYVHIVSLALSVSLSPPPTVNPLWSAARLSIGSNKDSLAQQREAQPAEYREYKERYCLFCCCRQLKLQCIAQTKERRNKYLRLVCSRSGEPLLLV